MDGGETRQRSAAEALLNRMADVGIDYIFGNAGTDFASIIEALSTPGVRAPQPVTVPHENVAVAMAHGCYLATGRQQAVMVHVNVGTANTICGLLNAARDNVPMLVMAGRTPIHEDGVLGARTVFIHWGQEMFDQGGMVREIVKWDYELKSALQVDTVVDRMAAVTMAEPRGPAYLTLPRETLAAPAPAQGRAPTATPTPAAPEPQAVAKIAEWIAEARHPVLITNAYGQNPADVPALATLAERWALPVVPYRTRYVALPHDHPCLAGFEPGPWLKDADLALVVDCDVPFIPVNHGTPANARLVQIGADPLFGNYPIRGFPASIALTSNARLALEALTEALRGREGAAAPNVADRRRRIEAFKAERTPKPPAAPPGPLTTMPWLIHCLNQVKADSDIVLTETAIPLGLLRVVEPGTYFGTSAAGGLGWGLGASLGLKLGRRDRRVISILGDGSYMFGNPTPAHFVAEAMDLPTLTIIANNRMWAAVRRATLSIHPDGAASKANRAPLTYLEPSPSFEKVVEASGGVGLRVERPEDLEDILRQGLHLVDQGRQVVVNVLTGYSDDEARVDAKR